MNIGDSGSGTGGQAHALLSALARRAGMHRPNLAGAHAPSYGANTGGGRMGGPQSEGDPNAPQSPMLGVSPQQLIAALFGQSVVGQQGMNGMGSLPFTRGSSNGGSNDLISALLQRIAGASSGGASNRMGGPQY